MFLDVLLSRADLLPAGGKEILADQFFPGNTGIIRGSLVDKGQCAIGQPAVNQFKLVFNDRLIVLLAIL